MPQIIESSSLAYRHQPEEAPMSPKTTKARALFEAAECFGAVELIDALLEREARGETVTAVWSPKDGVAIGTLDESETALERLTVMSEELSGLTDEELLEFDARCRGMAESIIALAKVPPSGYFIVSKGPTSLN